MSDLQLGPVIGKLGGGAEIHTIPVDFVPSSGTGMKHVVDVPVPTGATARVVVVGSAGGMASNTNVWPILFIGGQNIGIYHTSVGGSATVTGPVAVEVDRRGTTPSYDPSFVGTVYWWEEVTGDPGGDGGDPGEGVTTVPVGTFTDTDKTIHTVVLDSPSIVSAHLTGIQEAAGSTGWWGAPAPSIEVRPPSGGVWGETRFGRSLMVPSDTSNVPPESQRGNARYLSISATLPPGEYRIVVNSQGSSRTCTVDTATITVTPHG